MEEPKKKPFDIEPIPETEITRRVIIPSKTEMSKLTNENRQAAVKICSVMSSLPGLKDKPIISALLEETVKKDGANIASVRGMIV